MRAWILGWIVVAAGGPVLAQEARLTVATDTVSVGERFDVSVAIEHSEGSTVTFPAVPPGDPEEGPLLELGDAELFFSERLPPRIESGTRVDSLVYRATTFSLDEAIVGPVVVEVIAGGDTSLVRSNTVAVHVRSVLAGSDANLRPPGPPVSFPNPFWVWVMLAAAAAAVSGLLIWAWRRSGPGAGRGTPRLQPYPEATIRLERLQLPENGPAIKPFYVELSELLRTYLSRTLGTPALELTTREVVHALSSDERVPERALKNIRGTLRVADLVKFADMRPEDDAHATAFQKTREAVQLVEATVRPPEEHPESRSATEHPESTTPND